MCIKRPTHKLKRNLDQHQDTKDLVGFLHSIGIFLCVIFPINTFAGEKPSAVNSQSDSPCSESERIDSRFNCKTTQKLNQASMLSLTAGMAAVSGLTQAAGENAQERARNSGTQRASLEAAAQTQRSSGASQLALGALTAAIGAYQLNKGIEHSQNARRLENESGQGLQMNQTGNTQGNRISRESDQGWVNASAESIAQRILQKYQLNEAASNQVTAVNEALKSHPSTLAEYRRQREMRGLESEKHFEEVKRRALEIGRRSASEQKNIAQEANSGGAMALMIGMQQMKAGQSSLENARKLEAQVDSLESENTANTSDTSISAPDLPPGDDQPRVSAPFQPFSVSNPERQNTGDGESTDMVDEGRTLGDGFSPQPIASDIPEGQEAGKFIAGLPENKESEESLSFPSGGTPPATEEDPGEPELAKSNTNDFYESSGNAPTYAAGNVRAKPDTTDLSKIFEQFLPKPDEKGLIAHRPILLFDGKEDLPKDAYTLGPRQDLFKRISQAYQRSSRLGFIGL